VRERGGGEGGGGRERGRERELSPGSTEGCKGWVGGYIYTLYMYMYLYIYISIHMYYIYVCIYVCTCTTAKVYRVPRVSPVVTARKLLSAAERPATNQRNGQTG